jgi:alpha-ketoglutarate-dependent taurine dioxygenase/4-hydroxybenzoate polyprenyltransferase
VITTRVLEPFGIEVRVPPGTPWDDVVADVHRWVAEHRLVVLRGLRPFDKAALPGAARRLGPLQAWSFGAVNELKPEPDPKNYLYTRRAVPLHWDGAFVGRAPRYLFFHCVTASDLDAGGETVFVDTTRVWTRADEPTRDRWRALRFTYATERVVHYGGRFSAEVVGRHPDTGETVMRFAEPVDDLNPVSVRGEGLSPLESAVMITELRQALHQPAATLAHRWESGDVVIADNHALLHGRRPFAREASRHIRRVNIHRPERTWRDAIRDSLRVRRPEFMVAEIPILLVPALLVLGSLGALATARFAETAALFFLLFHFGDMINCLADRDLDAVYKTHLSEAVYGLGVRNVRWQLALTVLAAFGLTVHLAWQTGRWDLVGMVGLGILLAAQYSVRPLWLKGRGLWQVAALWAVIFIGPMLIVARILGGVLSPELLAVAIAYGAMQQGIVLVNTAEDLPEDEAAGIHTVAVSLGLDRCLLLSVAMVAAGGATVIGAMLWTARSTAASWSLVALGAVWCWVVRAIARTWTRVRGATSGAALRAVRQSARRMPIWITLTAWTTLLAAAVIGAGRP